MPVERLGGDAKIRAAVENPVSHLQRTALLDVQANRRMSLHEALDHRRQGVARLSVGGGDGQHAAALGGVVRADPLHVLRLAEHPPSHGQHHRSGRRYRGEALAAALEDRHAEFFLEQRNLFGYPRLGSEQSLRRGGNTEAASLDFHQIPQLLKLHVESI